MLSVLGFILRLWILIKVGSICANKLNWVTIKDNINIYFFNTCFIAKIINIDYNQIYNNYGIITKLCKKLFCSKKKEQAKMRINECNFEI